MAVSHANCTHPRTPAGRRACRASSLDTQDDRNHRENGWIAGLRAVKRSEKPVRIQPRRSGARVAATSSACVQAALHTRGRCACGWESWELVA